LVGLVQLRQITLNLQLTALYVFIWDLMPIRIGAAGGRLANIDIVADSAYSCMHCDDFAGDTPKSVPLSGTPGNG